MIASNNGKHQLTLTIYTGQVKQWKNRETEKQIIMYNQNECNDDDIARGVNRKTKQQMYIAKYVSGRRRRRRCCCRPYSTSSVWQIHAIKAKRMQDEDTNILLHLPFN